ncbi:MAG: hypothetical protein IKA03_00060 [Alphaproteobacteria bacterium]|nr:hypothetical protein [Alphaproteobacteria bacterium]
MSKDFEQMDLDEKDLLSDAADLNLDDFLDSETAEMSLNDKDVLSDQDESFAELFSSDDDLDEILSEEVGGVAFDDVQPVVEDESSEDKVEQTEVEVISDAKANVEDTDDTEVVEDNLSGANENVENEQNADIEAADNAYSYRQENTYVRWYDGKSTEPQYEIDKNSESKTLIGSDDCKNIHINIGFDAYGWLVRFANGVVMSVDDVREYQLRNGALPDSAGVITYATMQIEFQNIEKIKVYESVRYFTYA